MDMEKIVCRCRQVKLGDVVKAVEGGAKTYEEVQEITKCGTGCGRCADGIKQLIASLAK